METNQWHNSEIFCPKCGLILKEKITGKEKYRYHGEQKCFSNKCDWQIKF